MKAIKNNTELKRFVKFNLDSKYSEVKGKDPIGYVFIVSFLDSRKQRTIYCGQTIREDSYWSYWGSGVYLRLYYRFGVGKNTLVKTVVGYAYTKEELNEMENYFIKKYNPIFNNYCKTTDALEIDRFRRVNATMDIRRTNLNLPVLEKGRMAV